LPASSVSRRPGRSRQEAVSERAQEALADDVHARDEIAFDAVRLQEVASGDRRAVEGADDLTDVDSGPAIVQLAEARRLVVRARSGPLLGPVGAHLLLAMPSARAVGPVDVVADPGHQCLDVLGVVAA